MTISSKAIPEGWYAVGWAKNLKTKPVQTNIMNQPIVLFRDEKNQAVSFLDRCPHRNAPLSLGKNESGNLRCAYHGWLFNSKGECVSIPGAQEVSKGKNAERLECEEGEGLIWVKYGKSNRSRLQLANLNQNYEKIEYTSFIRGELFHVLENMLDVVHTAFLHRGIFRKPKKAKIKVRVTSAEDKVEAFYIGEERPEGILGKFLAPEGGEVEHIDRFFMPAVAQVEYRIGNSHLLTTSFVTPEKPNECRIYSIVQYNLNIPNTLVRAIGVPLAKMILRQDRKMVEAQSRNIEQFGEEKFAFSSSDVLGPRILRLLHQTDMIPEQKETELTLEI